MWELALLSAKWISFLVITEKCIITFDYAAIKDARLQLPALVGQRWWACGTGFIRDWEEEGRVESHSEPDFFTNAFA